MFKQRKKQNSQKDFSSIGCDGNLVTFGVRPEELAELVPEAYEHLNNKLPVELVDIIQGSSDIIATQKLIELYSLDRRVANCLWQGCKMRLEDYKTFRLELIAHPWEDQDASLPGLRNGIFELQKDRSLGL